MFADTQTVARRVAERVSAELGEPLWLRDYPVAIAGEIGRVVLGVERGALHRAIAIVDDLGATRSAAVEVASPAGPALRGHQLGGEAREHALAAAITGAIRGRPEPWPLGLLDAGFGVLDALGQRLGVAGSGWRLATWGEWEAEVGRSGASIELYGDHAWTGLISIRAAPDGVTIRIPAGEVSGDDRVRAVTTPGGLIDALGGIVDDVRTAVDGRAGFRVRPDGIGAVGRQLLDAIRSAGALRGSLRVVVHDGAGFPHAWPTATIERVDDQGGHSYVTLAESAAGVSVTIDETLGPYRGFAAMARDLPRIVDAVRTAADRLRPDHLIEGRTYVVIAPIAAAGMRLEPGTRLIFVGIDHVPRDGFVIYRFTAAGPGGDRLELADYDDADVAILRRLHEVLARADPA